MLHLRAARFADAAQLAPQLRFADAREIATMWGVGAGVGLMACLLHSDRACAVVDADHRLAALCGVSDIDVQGWRAGVPWLLGSSRLFAGRRALIEFSRYWLGLLLADYDLLTNVTNEANRVHLRWLEWCGFRRLRRHARYGVAQTPCWELYLINQSRHPDPGALQAALLRRAPPAQPDPLDNAAGPLAALAAAVLAEGWHDSQRAAAVDAVRTLDRAISNREVGPRLQRNALALARELAAAVVHPTRGRGGASAATGPWGELCRSMMDVAQAACLHTGGCDMTPPAPAPARQPLDALLHRHGAMLTEAGRVTPVQGWRVLRSASLGRDVPALVKPAWRRELEASFREHALKQALQGRGRLRSSALLEQWRNLLGLPLDHAVVMASLRTALPADHVLAESLRRQIDGWAVAERPDVAPGEIGCVGDAIACAGRLADVSSRAALPDLRLGRVVGGLGDRLWLWRLLRARLVEVACGPHAGVADCVLRHDVLALLMAAALEEAWLQEPTRSPWPQRLQRLAAAALRPLGPLLEVDDDLRLLALWLQPVLAVPVVHGLELQPALTAWYRSAHGELVPVLAEVSHFLDDDPGSSRQRLRLCLRRLARRPDTVDVQRLLGLENDLGRSVAQVADPTAAAAAAGAGGSAARGR